MSDDIRSPSPAQALPPLLSSPGAPPLVSAEQAEREPISGTLGVVEALLRQPRRVAYWMREGGAGRLTLTLLLVTLACSLVYGLVVGSFSMKDQLWKAPLKICAGLFLSAFICLPSLYIFACLSGARVRLTEVGGLVAGALALMTILLIGFAPVAWIFSQSTESVPAMGALHLLFWAIATYFCARFLQDGFSHLGGRPAGLRLWFLIFLLVMIQMTTALRPLVGTADTVLPTEKKFFMTHWMEQLRKK